jgi:alpha-L-rhamnosidase
VRGASFRVPDDYSQAPSTDGIDVDSSRDVLIERCLFSVTDDCIAIKGSRGPRALDNPSSPPVERVMVRDCTFRRGHAAVTLGSEATIVRDVIVEKSRVLGAMAVLNFKLRSDTPQTYENIHYHDLVVDSPGGSLLSIKPWGQYIDLQGLPPPQSVVRNISVSKVSGRFGGFGVIRGNHGQTAFGEIMLRDIDVRLARPALEAPNLPSLRLANVLVNGAPATP